MGNYGELTLHENVCLADVEASPQLLLPIARVTQMPHLKQPVMKN